MIGDSLKDVEAGKNAGCKESFLVSDGESILDVVNKII